MDYGAVILGWKRPESLKRTVDSVKAQHHPPATIVVWHNAPSSQVIEGVVNVVAGENFGCPARHAVALLMSEEVVVFVDDDLELIDQSICERLASSAIAAGVGVVGWRGRNIAPDGPSPYSIMPETPPGPADVVKGLLHATRRQLLAEAFRTAAGLSQDIRREDDIVLSASITMQTGLTHWVDDLPARSVAVTRDGCGLENRSDHMQRRDAAAQAMIALGWRPPSWD
ncbi:MAG: hypothetical protein ABFD92_16765 [Planctomycetaceae bacterium]|nr:hypothetical protein [Planctomycetaceae bacterium]